MKDVRLFLSHVFDKNNLKKIGPDGPSINGCADAVTGLLCYEKWIKEANAVGEVMALEERIGQVLTKIKQKFPRREGTKQWNLQKNHGAFKMGTSQMCQHGNGDGWDSSYGERMHGFFLTKVGHNTQRMFENFASQLAD